MLSHPSDRADVEQTITPTADQRALLDDFANASIRAAQAIKEACPTTIAFAPTGRLDAMERRIAGMIQAIDIVGPPLDKFFASLTDEQKARCGERKPSDLRGLALSKRSTLATSALAIVEKSELLWVHPKFTCHLHVLMRQVEPAPCVDPRLQACRYLFLILLHH
jgi:hypothetical protein